jgi:ATP-binding cassette, subfamily F, member 3
VKAVEVGGTQALDVPWSQFMHKSGISGDKWQVPELERRIKSLENPNPRLHRPHMQLHASHRSHRTVLRSTNLLVGYPANPLFLADDIHLERGEVAALIGPNGTGKSTFLKLLQGDIEPLNGRFHLGTAVKIGYFAQAHETLNSENLVLDELLSVRNLPVGTARDHLAEYLFRNDDVFKPVAALSGGERGRLALAKLALYQANFLLLDEPTNHLDLMAQEVLEEALLAYNGTILLVSHDRYLIDKLATQIWILENGNLRIHLGDYQSYLAEVETAVIV